MADLPTADDIFQAGRRAILIAPTKFDKRAVDTDGSDVNVLMAANAAMGEEVVRFAQQSANETHLSTALTVGEEAVERWVYDNYQLIRNQAASSVATLDISRINTAQLVIAAGSLFGTDDGQQYEIINDVVFSSGNTGPLSVVARATQTGPEGDAAPGTITTIVSNLGDDSISVTNPEVAAGGRDQEPIADFASRARDFFVDARRGTLGAIQNGALTVANIAQATATELIAPETLQPGFRVNLVIADQNGQANSALADTVREELLEFRGAGVPVAVLAGIPQFIDIIVTGLQFVAGANTSNVLDNARTALLGEVNALAPGATLRRALLTGTLQGVEQLIVPDGAVTEPDGDLVPGVGRVIRTEARRITFV